MVDYNSKGDDMECESIKVYRAIAREIVKR
jgi:hypothetical protein